MKDTHVIPINDTYEEETHLRDYVLVILRRKWILIVSFIFVLTLFTYYTFKATPIYQATTIVKIDRENPNVLAFEEVLAIDSQDLMFYQTQCRILTSRSLAQRVISALNLKHNPEFRSVGKSKGFSITRFLSSLIMRESQGTDKDISGKGIPEEEDAKKSELIDNYIKRLEVTPIRNSRLVNISFTGVNPDEIKKIVNRHAAEYIDNNLEVRFAASNDAVKWLRNQIVVKKELVEKAENALQRFKEERKIVSLEDRQNIIFQKLEDLNSRLTDSRTEKMKLETLYNLIEKYAGKQEMLETIPEIMENELILKLKDEYVGLLTEIKRLSKRYGKNHPTMIRNVSKAEELKTKINEEVIRIARSIGSRYKVALSQEESLSKALEAQKEVALQLNRDAITYGTLKREKEGEREVYEILLKRLKETDITGELQTSNISIVDLAETPLVPIKPRKKRNVILGTILGLFIGIGLVFFLEYIDNTIKSPEDVEQYLGIPLLGVLEKVKLQAGDKSAVSELIAYRDPRSVFAEAIRTIRTSVIFSIIDKPKKLIMVTSAIQGEGKTFVTTNLAAAIAQTGKKTLIVDTDLRKPRLNKIFSVKKSPGLSNYLIGENDLESIIKSTPVPDLSIITCGTIPPNPSEILESKAMEKFCNKVREMFDIVIFDTPPSMVVTDAVVLSRSMDGVIITIKSGSTVKDTVNRCISQLKSSKCEILGAVANYEDIVKGSYYYHYGNYYKYRYSGEKELEEVESA